jgi:hypothetical protein
VDVVAGKSYELCAVVVSGKVGQIKLETQGPSTALAPLRFGRDDRLFYSAYSADTAVGCPEVTGTGPPTNPRVPIVESKLYTEIEDAPRLGTYK